MSSLPLRLAAGERIAQPVGIVLAHPDDETVGLGGHLARFEQLHLIHLTDGAPRNGGDAARAGFACWQDYACARARELSAALDLLGAGGARRTGYGIADQGLTERLSEAVERLTGDLAGVSAVVTHGYEHGHPDHDAAALAVALACRRLGERAPERLEFPSYHLAGGQPLFGRFWPDPDRPATELPLSPAARERKRAALACFASQAATLAQFPLDPEWMRFSPDYDFAAPAPPGDALYTRWGIGGSAGQWRAHVAPVWEDACR